MAIAPTIYPEVEQVVTIVKEHPGLSRARVRAQLPGRKDRRDRAIRTALQEGRIFEGPGSFNVRGGAKRSGIGLHPVPIRTEPSAHPLWGSELRAARTVASITQEEFASRLGVNRVLIAKWESGRQKLPPWAPLAIDNAIAEGPGHPIQRVPRPKESTEQAWPRVKAAISADPGLSISTLKKRIGHSAAVLDAVEFGIGAGEIHRGEPSRSGRGGSAIYPGPWVPPPPLPAPSDLRSARVKAGWSMEHAAELLGVAPALYGRWERGVVPIPAWSSSAIEAFLDEADRNPREDPVAQIVPEIVSHIKQSPGITREQVRRHLVAHRPSVVHRGIERASAEGLIYGSRGLYLGALPTPIGPDELSEARREAGWSSREFARLLGVSPGQMSNWESGLQLVPPQHRIRIRELLTDDTLHPIAIRKTEILAAVRAEPGITAEWITRSRAGQSHRDIPFSGYDGIGRDKVTARALEELLREGEIHVAPHFAVNAAGTTRSVHGYFSGAAPAKERKTIRGQEVEDVRRRAGWSRKNLASRVGVSDTQIMHWVRIPVVFVHLFRSIPYTGSDVFVHLGERSAGVGVM